MADEIVGKCSRCGGAVVVPSPWMSVDPPPMVCRGCGATKEAHERMKTIDMGNQPKEWTTYGLGNHPAVFPTSE